MRILLVNHFPLEGSGSGVYTKNIAKSLKARGHEISIIMPENTINYEKIDGIKMHPVYFKNKEEIKNALPFNFPCFTTHPRSTTNFYDLTNQEIKMYEDAFEQAIKEEIEIFKPDVIHAQHIWILADVSSRFELPLIITAHGTDLMGYKKDTRFHKYCDRAVNYCKNIVTISKDSNDLVIKTFPQAKEKAKLIKNGYDPHIFYPEKYDKEKVLKDLGINKKYEKVVSFVGKLTEFKGVDILLKATKEYEEDDILTLVVGDGELFDDLNSLAKKLELKNVKFLGNKPHEFLRKIYNIANVSVVPSRREPFGLVALEAMACGTPVIGTNQGGIPDFLKPDLGILVEVENSNELANKIKEVLDNENKFNRNHIAEYIKENYSQDKLIENLIKLYKN